MICPNCGKNNPDTNRFCGNCGTRLGAPHPQSEKPQEASESRTETTQRVPTLLGLDLPKRETHYPREGYEPQAETPPVSSLHEEFPPELIEYDQQVPLIAEPGSDRRIHHHFSATRAEEESARKNATRGEQAEVPPNEYAPVRSNNQERIESRISPSEQPSPRSQQPYSAGYTGSSILGLNTPTADEVGFTESAPTVRDEEERYTADASENAQVQSGRDHFLDFSEPARRDESLHGPSFLGLSSSPEDYEQEETVSHGRRNFALFVLVLLAVLIALQWRSIRDFGVQYAQRGGVHIPGMKAKNGEAANKGSGNATDANATNSTAVNGGANSVSNNDNGPNIEVAPTQTPNTASANQGQNSGAAQAPANSKQSSAENQGSTTAHDSTTSADNSGATKTTAPPKDQKQGSEVASNSAAKKGSADDMPQGEPNDGGTTDEDTGDETPARVTTKSKSATPRQPADDPSRLGAAELANANAASDPQTRVSWLWKATAKGNWEAPVRLSEMYITGNGVEKDCDQAMVILRSAAAKKNGLARSKLGSLYATGQCVSQDRVAAYHWMTLALQANPGSEWIGHNRQSLWNQMNTDERQRAARDRQ